METTSMEQFELILSSDMEIPSPMKSFNEEILFGDDFANHLFSASNEDFTSFDVLAELEKDENMYSDELQDITEKIDLPLFDFVTGMVSGENVIESDRVGEIKSKTEQLLMEFDSIYDAVEIDQLPQLQTLQEENLFLPDIGEIQFIQNIHHIDSEYPSAETQEQVIMSPNSECDSYSQKENYESDIMSADIIILHPEPIISSPADLKRELEVVDEIIQAHSYSQFDEDSNRSTSSWSPRSDYSSSSSSQEEVHLKKSSTSRGVKKRRGRNPEEKKFRKKEQNKNAATRYRLKKKEEVHVILGEERILMDKNHKLRTTLKDTNREVKYLKSLLRELFQARGLLQ